MSQESEEPPPAGGVDFTAYIAAAQRDGSVRICLPEGELFLVAPQFRRSGAPTPFEDAGLLLKLPLARAAYSDRMAWVAATLSELAYLPYEQDVEARENLAAALGRAELALVDIFDNPETGTQGFLVHRQGAYCVLAFRGTEKNRKDIITDLNARFYDTPGGRAHRGFSVAYESVRGHVVKALEKIRAQDKGVQIFVTGHSLGGALAMSAACDLEKRFLIAACYTFGSPRVGTPEWADGMKTPVYRVVNGADGVPLAPGGAVAEWLIGLLPELPALKWIKERMKEGFVGFQHAGDLRFLGDKGGIPWLKIGSAAGWARFKHFLWGKIVGAVKSLSPKSLSDIFADHSISEYRRKLKSIAEQRNRSSGQEP